MRQLPKEVEELSLSGTVLPMVVRPTVKGIELAQWIDENRDSIEERITKYGAVLFRGFNIDSLAKFDRFVHAASSKVMPYMEASSPRSHVGGRIYTSTDYPSNQHIFPHNETSYAMTFPLRLFFCCEIPPQAGGQTPLADCRKILQRIPRSIQHEFGQKKWMYVRNLGAGFGLSWATVFETEDKSEVEAHCHRSGIQLEWLDENRLRTRQVRPAIARHPRTGELVWFNHMAFFHISTLEPSIREALLQEFIPEDLPNNTYYGDGSQIDESTLNVVRNAYYQEMVSFEWNRGDVVVVDNMLVSHARTSYTGNRRILFAMAEPTTHDDVKV